MVVALKASSVRRFDKLFDRLYPFLTVNLQKDDQMPTATRTPAEQGHGDRYEASFTRLAAMQGSDPGSYLATEHHTQILQNNIIVALRT